MQHDHGFDLPAGQDRRDGLPQFGEGARLRLLFDEGTEAEGMVEALDPEGRLRWRAALARLTGHLPALCDETPVETPTGPCAAGDLAAGAVVHCALSGPQVVTGFASCSLGWQALGLLVALRPVHIAPGALGPGLPRLPLMLAPSAPLWLPGHGAPVTPAQLLGREGVTRSDAPAARYLLPRAALPLRLDLGGLFLAVPP